MTGGRRRETREEKICTEGGRGGSALDQSAGSVVGWKTVCLAGRVTTGQAQG